MCVWFLSPLPHPGLVVSSPEVCGVLDGAGEGEACSRVGVDVGVVAVVEVVAGAVAPDGAGAGVGLEGRPGFGAEPRPALAALGPVSGCGAGPAETTGGLTAGRCAGA